MRTSLVFAVVVAVSLLAAAAIAGTRFVDTAGAPPSGATDGVSLLDVGPYGSVTPITACRGTIRFSDGGTIMGGSLVPHYYDAVVGWIEGKDSDQCALSGSKLLDGGSRHSQYCEWTVTSRFGRAALAGKSLIGEDGGSVVPIMRLECWCLNCPSADGGAQ
jgi:hypothetical protein